MPCGGRGMSRLLLCELRPLVPTGLDGAGAPDAPIDVLIEDGRIVALAPAGELAAPAAEAVELGGRWLVPGLWDSHVHLGQAAIASERVDLVGCASAAEVAARLAAAVAAGAGQHAAVLGVGFRDALWAETPTAALLDAIPSPVVAVSADVHTVWSNRLALAGIGASPEQWFAREQLAFDLGVSYGRVPPELVDRSVAKVLVDAVARGIVGLVDFDMDDAGAAWARRLRTGTAPRIRVEAAVYPKHLADAVARGQRTGEPIGASLGAGIDPSGLVCGGPYKLFADGSLNTRTAWCDEPYPGSGGDTGVAVYQRGGLEAELRRASAAGLVPAVHAIGDAAVAAALDAYAETGMTGSIEHAQLIRRGDASWMARLGLVASVQPAHLLDDREVAERHWAGRIDRAYAFRTMLDAGVSLRLGSDAPVAPLNPWLAISAAVFRGRAGESPWNPGERLEFAEAVAASARTRIRVGEQADLVLLDYDPRRLDADALAGLRSAGTMVDGCWTALPR